MAGVWWTGVVASQVDGDDGPGLFWLVSSPCHHRVAHGYATRLFRLHFAICNFVPYVAHNTRLNVLV